MFNIHSKLEILLISSDAIQDIHTGSNCGRIGEWEPNIRIIFNAVICFIYLFYKHPDSGVYFANKNKNIICSRRRRSRFSLSLILPGCIKSTSFSTFNISQRDNIDLFRSLFLPLLVLVNRCKMPE